MYISGAAQNSICISLDFPQNILGPKSSILPYVCAKLQFFNDKTNIYQKKVHLALGDLSKLVFGLILS